MFHLVMDFVSRVQEYTILNILKMNKTLYKGLFNWKGESNTLYKYAISETVVFSLFIQSLSKQYRINRSTVRMYFQDTDKYKIRKEIK